MLRVLSNVFMALVVIMQISFAQEPKMDKGKFIEDKHEFMDKIQDENKKFSKDGNLKFILDFSGMDLPKSTDEFKSYWHNDPLSQGASGMCWCYCTTSFYESEIYRTTGRGGFSNNGRWSG